MREVYDFLKKTKTYFLATVEGDQPRVRPFGTADIFEGKLYIQTGLSKAVARQLRANGKVEICAFDGKTWLRLAATAVLDEGLAAQEHMLETHPNLRAMYAPGDGNNAVFYLKDATAAFYTYGGGAPRTVTF